MNPDDDIRIALPVRIPVMANVVGGRCAWTDTEHLPLTVKRVDAAEVVRHEVNGMRAKEVFLYGGRAYSTWHGRAEEPGLAGVVAKMASDGVAGIGAVVALDYQVPAAKRGGPRAVHRDLRTEALGSLAAERDLLVHDGERVYRAWRRGPVFVPGPGVVEPSFDEWELGYSPGRSEDHFAWCSAMMDGPARNATESIAQAERDCHPDVKAAMPPDADILNFMELAPIRLLGMWAPMRSGGLGDLGESLRDLAGRGLARALDEGRRIEDLQVIRAAAGALMQGRRAPIRQEAIRSVLAWCEAVALPRVLAAPIQEEDAEAISGLAP